MKPVGCATKITPSPPAFMTFVARTTDPHSLVPSGLSVQSTIANAPATPVTAVQALAGTATAISVGP
jgi:hypothetical protein